MEVSKEQAKWNEKCYRHGASLQPWISIALEVPQEFREQAKVAYDEGLQVELEAEE